MMWSGLEIASGRSTTSGHGSSRCHAVRQLTRGRARAGRARGRRSTMSSPIRCSTSRFTHGREPSRTVSSCGWYCVAPGVGEPLGQAVLARPPRRCSSASPRRCRRRRRSARASHPHTDASWRNSAWSRRCVCSPAPTSGRCIPSRPWDCGGSSCRTGPRASAGSAGTSASRRPTCRRRPHWPQRGTRRGSSGSGDCWRTSAAARASTSCWPPRSTSTARRSAGATSSASARIRC